MMFRRVNCSVHERPLLKPACSSRKVRSTASCSLFRSDVNITNYNDNLYLSLTGSNNKHTKTSRKQHLTKEKQELTYTSNNFTTLQH